MDGLPGYLVLLLHLDAWNNLHLVVHLPYALGEGATDDSSHQVLGPPSWHVAVEAAGDGHSGRRLQVVVRGGDVLLDGLDEHVQVDLLLGGYGDDGRVLGHRTREEAPDVLVVGEGRLLVDEVDLVLDDDDVLDADDVQRHQVLLGLGLGAHLVRRYHEDGAVHETGAAEHDGHEGLVARGVDEADGPEELRLRLAGVGVRGEALWRFLTGAAVEGAVGVTQLDRDAPLHLLGVLVRPHARQRLGQRCLPVVHVADQADIHLGLSG